MTRAKLVRARREALRLDPGCDDRLAHHVPCWKRCSARADEFDVIHFHIDYLTSRWRAARGAARDDAARRLDIPDLAPLYDAFPDVPLVSISDAQREPLPMANWRATVHHGLPPDALFTPPGAGELPGVPRAGCRRRSASTAPSRSRRALGMPLKIAAKIDKEDQEYFETEIKPLLDDPRVEFVGEIGEAQKDDFLGNAARAAVPDRLAGAVRAGDDRGDGVRHAGGRVPPRLGARGDRGRCRRASSSKRSTRRSPRRRASLELPRALPRHFETASARADGARLRAGLRARWRRTHATAAGGRTAIGLR